MPDRSSARPKEKAMMFAIYFMLAWSLVGCVAALLMGRAIAIGSGEQQQAEMAAAGASLQESAKKVLPAAKAA
jgi:hypothetical protein